MTEELKTEIERLINLKKTNKYDVQSMIKIIRENIDKKISVCPHCAAQIRFAQRRLTMWYSQETQTEEVIIEPIVKGVTTKSKKGLAINTPKTK